MAQQGVNLTRRAAKKVADLVRQSENESPRQHQKSGGRPRGTERPMIFAKVTAENTAGVYSLKLRRYNSSTNAIEDDDRNITSTDAAIELNGAEGIPVDTEVVAWIAGRESDGTTRWLFIVTDICAQLKTLTGFDDTKTQALMHVSGACQWYDTGSC